MQNATQAHRHLIATNNNAGDKNRSHVSGFRVQNMANTIGHLQWERAWVNEYRMDG